MSRFLFLIGLLLVLWYARRWWTTEGKNKSSSQLMTLALWGLAGIMLLLFVTGKGNLIVAVGATLLAILKGAFPWLQRAFPLFLWWRKTQAKQKQLQSDTIELKVDPLTGELSGRVLSGSLQGSALAELEQPQLQLLLDDVIQRDPKGLQLLAAYLESRFGNQWRSVFQLNGHTAEAPTSSNQMTDQEAREILGVSDQATAKEVNRAYKSLMQKVHPDRGGNEYLARLANEAKEVLLKSVE